MAKKKIKKQAVVKKVVNLELLYMTEQNVGVKEFEQVFQSINHAEVHVWTELDILELVLPSQKSVDLETMTDFMTDEEDLAFMKERNVATVYAITLEQECLEEFKPYMKAMVMEHGGFWCSDSDDFTPFYEL